jgi:AcrR family transcriptional regulator
MPPKADDRIRNGPSAAEERERLERALVEIVVGSGYRALTAEAVAERAGVGEDALARQFGTVEECFAAIWERCKEEIVAETSAAYLAASGWREGMRAAAWELCRWTDTHRDLSRIVFVELAFAPEPLRASRDVTFAAYSELIHQGNSERRGAEVPRATGEALMGAIWERLVRICNSGRFEDLPRQVPEMMYVLVLPYLGPAAAAEELRRGADDIEAYERGEL